MIFSITTATGFGSIDRTGRELVEISEDASSEPTHLLDRGDQFEKGLTIRFEGRFRRVEKLSQLGKDRVTQSKAILDQLTTGPPARHLPRVVDLIDGVSTNRPSVAFPGLEPIVDRCEMVCPDVHCGVE